MLLHLVRAWVNSHLGNEQDTTGPGQSPALDIFFLSFGETSSHWEYAFISYVTCINTSAVMI